MTMQPDPETLRQLLARVEGAAGAESDLGAEIRVALGQVPPEEPFKAWRAQWPDDWTPARPLLAGFFEDCADDPTASVDAALALVGRVHPDNRLSLGFWRPPRPNKWRAQVGVEECADCPTPALALLAALLRAKIAETGNA